MCVSQEQESFIITTLNTRQNKETVFRCKHTREIIDPEKLERTIERRKASKSQTTPGHDFRQATSAAHTIHIDAPSPALEALTPGPNNKDLDAPGHQATYQLDSELAAFLLGANDSKVLIDILVEVPNLAEFCAMISLKLKKEETWKRESANILWKNRWTSDSGELTTSDYTRSILHYVDLPMVHWLMELGASLDVCISEHAFRDAVQDQNLVIMEILLKHMDVMSFSMKGLEEAFQVACRDGNEGIARLLPGRFVDVNTRDQDGWTALIYASQNGHETVVKLLLDSHADINTQSYDGATALIYASCGGHAAVVKLLLEAHADINARDDEGFTALMFAREKGHEEVVKLLLSAEIDKMVDTDLHDLTAGLL